MDAASLLMRFGLTNQEARIYCTLCAEGELTGYEVAKLTGISRSNIYTALAGLVEKGAACLSEGTAARYAPVPAEEFCSNKIEALRHCREELAKLLPQRVENAGGYLTVAGESNILDKMRTMLEGSQKRVYASMSAQIMQRIEAPLSQAASRGLKVVLITEKPFRLDGAVVYYTEKKRLQIRMIVDSSCVLTGDIDDGEYSTCLYSMKKNLVDLFKEDLKNEIKLIQLTERK